MVKLFACLGSGNCMKPWLALSQLGQEFELQLVDVLKGEQKEPAFLQHNPLGVVPFMQTEDGCGLGESNAMLWHLCEGTDLMPKTATQRAQALQWMFFEQSKLEPFISPARFFSFILPDQKVERADDIAAWQGQAEAGLVRLNEHLADREFVLGPEYSIADIALFGYVHVLEEAGLNGEDFPAIMRWIDNVSRTENFRPLSELGRVDALAA